MCSVRLRATAENTPTPTPEPAAAWPGTPLEAAGQIALIALPSICGSLALPTLLAAARAAPGDTSALLAVLLGKRVALYAVAVCAVALVSLRSTGAAPGLGARVEAVTREGLRPFARADARDAADAAPLREAVRQLDETPLAAQATALPLALGALLLLSAAVLSPPAADDGGASLRAASAAVAPVSNFAVAALFVNAELQASALAVSGAAAEPDDGGEGALAPAASAACAALAAAAVAAAFALPRAWPLRNAVNVCVAVGVGRALQLPELAAVAGALVALAAYDVVGTSAPAGAAEVATSAMEGAARARLVGDGAWAPGLLVVELGGRVSDALGVGDVVFPAMLAGWARRRDVALADGGGGYLASALLGYAGGCVALELVGGTGGPALIELVPAMLLGVLGRAAARGELTEAPRGAPGTDGTDVPWR